MTIDARVRLAAAEWCHGEATSHQAMSAVLGAVGCTTCSSAATCTHCGRPLPKIRRQIDGVEYCATSERRCWERAARKGLTVTALDMALSDVETFERRLAAVEALADEWERTVYKLPAGHPMTTNEFCQHWFKAPLRAALTGRVSER